MRGRSVQIAAALGAAAALLGAAEARAFERTRVPTDPGQPLGPRLFWSVRALPFVLNERGSRSAGLAALDAARASFAVWSAPPCTDLTFPDRGTSPRIDVGYLPVGPDNANLIVWREESCAGKVPADDPCWDCDSPACVTCGSQHDCWDQQSATIAATLTTFSPRTGELFDADIELNGAGFVFTTRDSPPCPTSGGLPQPLNCVATDVTNTLVHEIGHLIGLDHVTDPAATMFRSADVGETKKRTLEQDDVDGVCAVYPRGGTTPIDPPADGDGGGGSSICQCGSTPAAALPWAALLAWLAGARRRRNPLA